MGVWVFLLPVVAVPLAMPLVELLGNSRGWEPWQESERLLVLAGNTARVVAGTLILAVPVGVLGAILLYRTDLPLRHFLRFLTVLSLFVPLPVFASAWQAALGTGGLLPLGAWSNPPPGGPDVLPGGRLWTPWGQGIGAAVWVQAVAGLPWVVILVGNGLCWVERELEEDALTVARPWQVLWHVTLPRCRVAVLAAALWVTLQTATEITLTDTMQVRTFAEEVYTQIVAGGEAAVARSVAVALPSVVLLGLLVLGTTRRLGRRVLPLGALSRTTLLFRLGRVRWLWLGVVLAVAALLVGVPLLSLVWKTGLSGAPPAWSAVTAWRHLVLVGRLHGQALAESLLLAAGAGVLVAALGLLLCWLAVGARWFEIGVIGLMAAAWALPGPVVGFGLKATINRLLNLIGSDPSDPDPVALALWYGPSPLPILWAYLLRLFPFALALVWPVVRLIPRELHDAACVDGARPGQDLRYVVLPLTWPTCLYAALAVTVLALGELSASKLVETPGSQTFAHEIFVQMHYGVANDLAAQCLLLLALVALGGTVVASYARALARKR